MARLTLRDTSREAPLTAMVWKIELSAFINMIEHLRSGMMNSVTVLDPAEATFVVSARDVVQERVAMAVW